jgi:hypothetical protein
MDTLRVTKWWFVLYLAAGLCLGLADRQLGRLVQGVGLRPGVATAVVVNIVMPIVAVGLAAAHPRIRGVVVGAVGMTVFYTLGLACTYRGHGWDVLALLRAVPPVLVLACAGYAVLGVVTTLLVRGRETGWPWRRQAPDGSTGGAAPG